MGSALRTKAACAKSVRDEMDAFRADLAPLLERMRKQFEAEDEALLAMHPGYPGKRAIAAQPRSASPTPRGEVE